MSAPAPTTIDVPFPEATDLHLRIGVGACRLNVRPGTGDPWISGTYQDPTGQVPCRILQDEGTVRVTQGAAISDPVRLFSGVPTFELALGQGRPYQLTVEVGASENHLDLGGLPLTRLAVKLGAGSTHLDFSTPNPQPLRTLELGAGAGEMRIRHLANANAEDIRIEGGAAAFDVDFGGALQRDTRVRVSIGMASVELRVSTETAAKVRSETVLGSTDVGDGWTTREGAFWNQAAVRGATPMLTIDATIALGSLRLRES